jgi:hypothetical protein
MMMQSILLGVVFLVAIIYLGRFIFQQIRGQDESGHCDKCLPKQASDKLKMKN